jgi:phosphoribosylformylglycinamidine (FGAM) synthase-like enzyme
VLGATHAELGSVVQIGDPIVEKRLADALPQARDRGLYTAITDCGAGGLSSAVGEMAGELGAEIELARVPLKYDGLRPWEIWLSEAQERMVLAVPPHRWSSGRSAMPTSPPRRRSSASTITKCRGGRSVNRSSVPRISVRPTRR